MNCRWWGCWQLSGLDVRSTRWAGIGLRDWGHELEVDDLAGKCARSSIVFVTASALVFVRLGFLVTAGFFLILPWDVKPIRDTCTAKTLTACVYTMLMPLECGFEEGKRKKNDGSLKHPWQQRKPGWWSESNVKSNSEEEYHCVIFWEWSDRQKYKREWID